VPLGIRMPPPRRVMYLFTPPPQIKPSQYGRLRYPGHRVPYSASGARSSFRARGTRAGGRPSRTTTPAGRLPRLARNLSLASSDEAAQIAAKAASTVRPARVGPRRRAGAIGSRPRTAGLPDARGPDPYRSRRPGSRAARVFSAATQQERDREVPVRPEGGREDVALDLGLEGLDHPGRQLPRRCTAARCLSSTATSLAWLSRAGRRVCSPRRRRPGWRS
jgi:hypothetical protein